MNIKLWNMKDNILTKNLVRLVVFIASLMFFVNIMNGQIVYITENQFAADYTVCPSTNQFTADYIIYITDNRYQAKNGHWFITDNKYQADFTVFISTNQYLSDYTIFNTSNRYLANCDLE